VPASPTELEALPEPEPALKLPDDWRPAPSLSPAHQALLEELTQVDLPPSDPQPAAPRRPAPAKPTTQPLPRDWIPRAQPPEAYFAILEETAGPAMTDGTIFDSPVQEATYHLPFTAVLVPRFPEHYLSGELARQLREWAQRFCLAWDWRADRISVTSGYLAIRVSLIPESAPAHAIEQLRDDLSRRVLERYPNFHTDLPSGRFWARAYLLIAGEEPGPDDIDRFVERTRLAQGLDG
jgi:REP element-mobilizing transposase RayT